MFRGKTEPHVFVFFKPAATTETPQECLTSKSLHTCMHSHNWIPPIFQSNRREAFTPGYFYVHGTAIQSLNDSSILMRCFYDYKPPSHTHTHTHTHICIHTRVESHCSPLFTDKSFICHWFLSSLDGFIWIRPMGSDSGENIKECPTC